MEQSLSIRKWITPLLLRWASTAWYRALARFPVPSESKWRGVVDLVVSFMPTMLRENEGQVSARYMALLGRALERAGETWAQQRSGWLNSGHASQVSATSTILVQAFKTLDLSTKLRAAGTELTTTTTHCPYMKRVNSPEVAQGVCKLLCSKGHSLFHGVAQGFPIHVTYRAPAMMGRGDPICIKVFRVIQPPAEPLSRPGRKKRQRKKTEEENLPLFSPVS